MPLHEYRCRSCDHQFEALVRPGSDEVKCPSCGGMDLEQQLSSFAVSSASTRKSNLQEARKLNRIKGRDKAIADREAIEHHRH